jgi:hypothetical protein
MHVIAILLSLDSKNMETENLQYLLAYGNEN